MNTIVLPRAPKIVDVSCAQPLGSIDAAKARADGVVGFIVRAEYGTRIDALFHAWIEWAIQNSFRAGVYVFQMTDADPTDEVRVLCNALGSYPLLYGVSLDVETRNGASPGNITTWSRAFMEETEQARAEEFGMLYTGPGFWSSLGDVGKTPDFAKRRLWVANYGVTSPMWVGPWGKWQQPNGPALHQRYGNTIWLNPASREQKWGPVAPGPLWKRIASAYASDIKWSSGEVDVNVLPGADDSPLLVSATAGGAAM